MLVNGLYFPAYEHSAISRGSFVPREIEVCRFAGLVNHAKSYSSVSRGKFVIAKSRSIISRGWEFSKMLVNGLYFPAYEHSAISRGSFVPGEIKICLFAGSRFHAKMKSLDSRGHFARISALSRRTGSPFDGRESVSVFICFAGKIMILISVQSTAAKDFSAASLISS